MKSDKITKEQLLKELNAQRKRVLQLEKTLNSLNSFEKAIETMQIGVTFTDLTGKIIYTNEADAKSHGYTVKELIGKDVRIFAPPKLWKPMRKEEIKAMNSWRRESKNIKKNGILFPVELKSDVVFNKEGEPVGIITTCEDITLRKNMEEKIQNLLITDELTGLFNRRGFFTLAEHQLEIIKRQKIKTFIVYADLDNLKDINDRFGHQEGDLALVETSNILKTLFRKSDIIARIAGDEFIVFPVGAADDSSEKITARMKKALDNYNANNERGYVISISIGVAYYDPKAPYSLDELIAIADSLMYKHKKLKKH